VEALELCTHGHVLEAGEIVRSGTRADLLADDSLKRTYLGL
jgi:ABC-type branched-subunit amino acid transport system ATPase component